MEQDTSGLTEDIIKIQELCKSHFGEVKFVGIKFHTKIGWVAKVQFYDEDDFGNLTAEGDNASDALINLKKRVKKIIKRYETV